MEGRAVLDTSAVLNLFSALDLSEEELEDWEIVVTECAEDELMKFSEHEDYLGKRAANSLKEVTVRKDPLSDDDLESEKKYLGLRSGGITDCYVQVLHLSFKLGLPFFTDDFSAHRHFTSHYPSKNLFFGILLVIDILGFSKSLEAESFVFEKLVPKRFPEITDRMRSNLKIAIDEFF